MVLERRVFFYPEVLPQTGEFSWPLLPVTHSLVQGFLSCRPPFNSTDQHVFFLQAHIYFHMVLSHAVSVSEGTLNQQQTLSDCVMVLPVLVSDYLSCVILSNSVWYHQLVFATH